MKKNLIISLLVVSCGALSFLFQNCSKTHYEATKNSSALTESGKANGSADMQTATPTVGFNKMVYDQFSNIFKSNGIYCSGHRISIDLGRGSIDVVARYGDGQLLDLHAKCNLDDARLQRLNAIMRASFVCKDDGTSKQGQVRTTQYLAPDLILTNDTKSTSDLAVSTVSNGAHLFICDISDQKIITDRSAEIKQLLESLISTPPQGCVL